MSEFFGTESVVVPDLPAPIVAYRSWKWDAAAGALVGFGRVAWPTDGPLTAECYGDPLTRWETRRQMTTYDPRFTNPPMPLPCVETPCADATEHDGYGCGIYAFDTVEQMAEHAGFTADQVWGKVEIGGTVYEHAHGYRASHGQVVAIYRVPSTPAARAAAAAYDVPLIDLPFTQAEIAQMRRGEEERKQRVMRAFEEQRKADLDALLAAQDRVLDAQRDLSTAIADAQASPAAPFMRRHPVHRLAIGAALLVAYYALLFATGLPVPLLWPLSLAGGLLIGNGSSTLYLDRKAARRG